MVMFLLKLIINFKNVSIGGISNRLAQQCYQFSLRFNSLDFKSSNSRKYLFILFYKFNFLIKKNYFIKTLLYFYYSYYYMGWLLEKSSSENFLKSRSYCILMIYRPLISCDNKPMLSYRFYSWISKNLLTLQINFLTFLLNYTQSSVTRNCQSWYHLII